MAAAETVKLDKRTIKSTSIKAGSRISVGRTFFDTEKLKYSDLEPQSVDRFYGTVFKVLDEVSGRITVHWDDDTTSNTYRNKVTLEMVPSEQSSQQNVLCNLIFNNIIIFNAQEVGGDIVHGQKLSEGYARYEIKANVNGDKWPRYDEDRHCSGTYIAWERAMAVQPSAQKSTSKATCKPKPKKVNPNLKCKIYIV